MRPAEARAVRAWLALAAAWVLAHELSAAVPLSWLWGVGAWALYPLPLRAGLAGAGLAALALAFVALWRAPGSPGGPAHLPAASPGPRSPRSRGARSARSSSPAAGSGRPRGPWIHFLWLVPLAAIVLWTFRGRGHLLGDGVTRLITTGNVRGAYKAPLDYLFNYRLATWLGQALGAGLERGQAVLSVLLGLASLPLLPGLLEGAGVPRGTRVAAGLVFMLSGWTLMFFGYLEAYPLYLFLELLFLWVGLRMAGRLRAALPLVPVWAAAMAAHFAAVLLAPALLYAPLARFLPGGAAEAAPSGPAVGGAAAGPAGGAGSPRARLLRTLPRVLGAALAVMAVVGLFFVRVGPAKHPGGVAMFLVHSLIWSLHHYLDTQERTLHYFTSRANLLALVWGGALVLLPLLLLRPGPGPAAAGRDDGPARGAREGADRAATTRAARDATTRARSLFLGLAAVGGLCALAYPGSLGAARDWDLIAASLVPAQLWVIARASRALGAAVRPAVLAATAVLAGLHAGPWIGLQTDAVRGREWVLRMWEQGPDFSDFTDHERILISGELMDEGAWARAASLLEGRGLLEKDGARLRVIAAKARLAARQPAQAVLDCEVAWHAGRRGAALEKLTVALLLAPGLHVADAGLEARARALGALDSAGSAGRFDEALERSAQALRRWPGEPLFLRRQAMAWLSLGRPDAALESALAAVRADSADAGGWSDLAHVYQQLGRPAEARAARDRGVKEDAPPP